MRRWVGPIVAAILAFIAAILVDDYPKMTVYALTFWAFMAGYVDGKFP